LRLIAAVFLLLLARGARAEEASKLTVTAVSPGTLVFSRTRSGQTEKEGLVVDSTKLVEALKARVLETRGLGEVAELETVYDSGIFTRGSSRQVPVPAYVFRHNFGAPFESLEASLRLRPLAEPDDEALILPLGALLGLCVVLGLYALYRTTATQIDFAERRSNFVSAVSHELKTPLTAIRMYAEMLEDDIVDDESRRREYYRTITAESERLSRLINNVLELSRIEKKTRTLPVTLGNLGGIVKETLDVLRPHIEREGFVLELEAEPALPSVQFEADALKQILFNLVDNALKYSREGGDRRIVVRLGASGPGRVVLAVRDYGPGVQKEHLKAVFQPFFRGERELTRKNQGTGIGLSLVRGLAERMGGSVRGVNLQPGFEVRVELAAG
jgi:signal transduction histidine kinase